MSVAVSQAPAASSIRFVLRRETRAEHALLDGHPDFVSLMDGRLDLDRYRQLMLAFHALYWAVDQRISDACAAHALHRHGFVYQPRSPILARDLACLGVTGPAVRRTFSAELPLASAFSLGGMLYVIEGSVLGGAMLCKAAEGLLGRTSEPANGYWQWCRQEAAARWAMTCGLLDQLAATAHGQDELIAGARSGFRLFAEGLDLRQDVALAGSLLR